MSKRKRIQIQRIAQAEVALHLAINQLPANSDSGVSDETRLVIIHVNAALSNLHDYSASEIAHNKEKIRQGMVLDAAITLATITQ